MWRMCSPATRAQMAQRREQRSDRAACRPDHVVQGRKQPSVGQPGTPKAAFQIRVSHSERARKQRRGDRERRGCVSRRVGSARGGICPCLREQAHLRFELESDQHRTVGRFRQLKAVAVPKPPPAESRRANSRPAGLSAATRHTHAQFTKRSTEGRRLRRPTLGYSPRYTGFLFSLNALTPST